jgi:hypothetical protein
MPAPLVCALAAPAALATEFPVNENPRCTYEVPAKMRLKAALSRGIPVEISCDGPAETSSILIIESRRQRERWEDLHNHGIPGISNSDALTFEEAGTKTLRVNILPKRFFRRYAKTKFRVLLGVEREPPYHTSVDSGKVVTAVR